MTQWGLDNLFNPGKRHMDDEKRRLQSTREEVGDSSGGRRIDLESGRVAISVRRSAADVEQTVENAELEPALAAEDAPAVALSNDEAEIEPEVVDSTEASTDDDHRDDRPIEAPAPQPLATPRKASSSANAWSRRG